jgi:hypothetical protein
MNKLNISQMENVQGGSCGFAIGMSVLSFAAMAVSGATVVGAALGIAGFYGSIIGVGIACAAEA